MEERCDCLIATVLRVFNLRMGSCLCKEERRRHNEESMEDSSESSTPAAPSCRIRGHTEHHHPGLEPRSRRRRRSLPDLERANSDTDPVLAFQQGHNVGQDVRDLIRQTLKVIRTLVNNDQEPPSSMLKLNIIADKEKGWLLVVKSLIETVPDSDSLGPAVICLFLDECPLPSKDTIHRLVYSLDLGAADCEQREPVWHKNACIVMGSLAEKLAGSSSVAMCSPVIMQYLMNCLKPTRPKQEILFALLALEKFAQTSENQALIARTFESYEIHPLRVLEEWLRDPLLAKDWLAQQTAFCAQWSLDNIFVTNNRSYAYESTDVSGINAMLNHEDVSEYLKIGPDGLEARCDVSSFESVRCTFEVLEGTWFYEAVVMTPGVMQIGFATKRSRFLNHEGYGIGDDESSVAYDGCRQLLWYNANSMKHEHPPWKPGDVVGCLLNLDDNEVMFYLNGVSLQQPHTEFPSKGRRGRPFYDGVFAAASFMSFQHCRFNFGSQPFQYPPSCEFRSFNEEEAELTLEQKTILPRRRRLEILKEEKIPENSCEICYANIANTVLMPCGHGGMCEICSFQLESCPMCRQGIFRRVVDESTIPPSPPPVRRKIPTAKTTPSVSVSSTTGRTPTSTVSQSSAPCPSTPPPPRKESNV